MRVHFIAIGGSAMHNLALALHKKSGYVITGSDDEIFEPSRSRLQAKGLLPELPGWFPEKITRELDVIILGMHARNDNPELLKAKELNLKIFSYPEYLYEQSKDKIRVVIGGSHGKTTITSMIMHVMKEAGLAFDYMVGAQVDGFDTMVSLSHNAKYMVIEGDEYLSSPDDLRPKFHLYHPHIALLSGIAWDHINVFPTFDNYVEQFRIFSHMIQPGGSLVWYEEDAEIAGIASTLDPDVQSIPYNTHPYRIHDGMTQLITKGTEIQLHVFGKHNLQNISGAKEVCRLCGIPDELFYKAIAGFAGAGKRLQKLFATDLSIAFLDFAHSPSKVTATIKAVREQFPSHKIIACLELHTFSSLKKDFLPQYNGSMDSTDVAVVFYNPHTIEHKRLEMISPGDVKKSFGNSSLHIITETDDLTAFLKSQNYEKSILLFMSSGNFGGTDMKALASQLLLNN